MSKQDEGEIIEPDEEEESGDDDDMSKYMVESDDDDPVPIRKKRNCWSKLCRSKRVSKIDFQIFLTH